MVPAGCSVVSLVATSSAGGLGSCGAGSTSGSGAGFASGSGAETTEKEKVIYVPNYFQLLI